MKSQPHERGTATIWVLGLCVSVMFLGGLSLDLWRGVSVRRELSALADAAATAGTNGIDGDSVRSGHAELDPAHAEALARDVLARSDRTLESVEIEVAGDRVVVTLEDEVRFSLLGIFVQGEPMTVRATAEAEPRVRS
ncbi:MAG: pilus assembly protein TadG-related protein [Actinomycetota bacterium]|nr:pilus assembly protein TadG-related protein [Actinomycetota bacterium]